MTQVINSKSAAVNPLSGHDSIEALTSNYKNVCPDSDRVFRGGPWFNIPSYFLRVVARFSYVPDGKISFNRFRRVSVGVDTGIRSHLTTTV